MRQNFDSYALKLTLFAMNRIDLQILYEIIESEQI